MGTNKELQTLLSNIRESADQLEHALATERAQLEQTRRVARGTTTPDIAVGRGTRNKIKAPVTVTPLAERIKAVLTGPFAPLDIRQIAAAVQEPTGKVAEEIKKLRSTPCEGRSIEYAPDACQVYNAGTSDDPRWVWVLGDNASIDELHAMVKRLISVRPMSYRELLLATGSRHGRLCGRLIQLQRDGEDVQNVGGDARTFKWHIVKPKHR